MAASNKGADPDALQGLPAAQAGFLRALWHGAVGRVVRCVPGRYTVMAEDPAGRVVFAKLRRGRAGDAAAEWRWLHVLPMLGFQAPTPVAFLQRRRKTMVVTEAVAGHAADTLTHMALANGATGSPAEFLLGAVAPTIARLHGQGIVFRDLYWNHLFATALGAGDVTLLDVERAFQPRWRRRRWIVKDLAGLLASAPIALPCRVWLRALHLYQGGRPPGWKALATAVRRKADKIRAHRPRYG